MVGRTRSVIFIAALQLPPCGLQDLPCAPPAHKPKLVKSSRMLIALFEVLGGRFCVKEKMLVLILCEGKRVDALLNFVRSCRYKWCIAFLPRMLFCMYFLGFKLPSKILINLYQKCYGKPLLLLKLSSSLFFFRFF